MLRTALVIGALSIGVSMVAGCGVNGTGVSENPGIPIAVAAAPAFAVSGTYKGTLVESQGTQSRSGTVVIVIKQSGSKISGTFDVTLQGKTTDLTLTGSLKPEKKAKAKLAFDIDNSKGRYASATAIVGKKRLKGKATVPAESSKPEVRITFKTKRTAMARGAIALGAGGRRNIVPQRSTV